MQDRGTQALTWAVRDRKETCGAPRPHGSHTERFFVERQNRFFLGQVVAVAAAECHDFAHNLGVIPARFGFSHHLFLLVGDVFFLGVQTLEPFDELAQLIGGYAVGRVADRALGFVVHAWILRAEPQRAEKGARDVSNGPCHALQEVLRTGLQDGGLAHARGCAYPRRARQNRVGAAMIGGQMDVLIWIGAAVSLCGVILLVYCIVAAVKARQAGLDEAQMRDKLQRLAAVNMGALGLSAIGLMMVVIGITLG